MPNGPWDGKERRNARREFEECPHFEKDNDDHDAIIAFGIKIGNHTEAIKAIASNHVTDTEKINKRIDWLYRIVWIGLGVGLSIQFILNLGKHG